MCESCATFIRQASLVVASRRRHSGAAIALGELGLFQSVLVLSSETAHGQIVLALTARVFGCLFTKRIPRADNIGQIVVAARRVSVSRSDPVLPVAVLSHLVVDDSPRAV